MKTTMQLEKEIKIPMRILSLINRVILTSNK